MESATTHGQQVINIKGQGRSDKEICGYKTESQFQSFLEQAFTDRSRPPVRLSNSVQLWTFYAIRTLTIDGQFILDLHQYVLNYNGPFLHRPNQFS